MPQPTLAAAAISLKASFEAANGANPSAALTPASNWLFFGTTSGGGDHNVGSIFEFDSSGAGSIKLKASFDYANGAYPSAALTPAGNGLFYGTTTSGGDNSLGSIFEFDPSAGGSIKLKASFDGVNGLWPAAALTLAGNGLFYGTTSGGGDHGRGSIFEFDPSGPGSITLKASFDGANGGNPFAALTAAVNGLLYGTTASGGDHNLGSIFAFDPSGGGSITLKASFDGANGSTPLAALTPADNGLFYGTTYGGGVNDRGAIFEFDPSSTDSLTLKASFPAFPFTEGVSPSGELIQASTGKFLGTAGLGGDSAVGTIYEFDPSPAASVPGPLPLLGTAAAFSWSRKLRQRMQQVQA
ncbi:MAG: choice-of-anchor tandem repeat GloVer-containing protein, partial [Synechococcaceae cyanobacterium]